MPYRFFCVPVRDMGTAEAELNAFLRGHRVLAVDRRWVDQGADEPQQQPGLPSGRSSVRGVDAPRDGTDRFPVPPDRRVGGQTNA